ncbi:hypothetical protein HanIR_Chr14g0709921 [Helianthus annuus]|nr:hypothetical protein HanIR_Chr14g0709921 [Helianthus annuus]
MYCFIKPFIKPRQNRCLPVSQVCLTCGESHFSSDQAFLVFCEALPSKPLNSQASFVKVEVVLECWQPRALGDQKQGQLCHYVKMKLACHVVAQVVCYSH